MLLHTLHVALYTAAYALNGSPQVEVADHDAQTKPK
jgi:hypothetical protein